MAQQPAGFVPDGFVPDGFEPEAASPQMNFATVNGQKVPVDGPEAAGEEFVKVANPLPGLATLGKVAAVGARALSGDVTGAAGMADSLKPIPQAILDAQNHVKAGADEAWAKGDYTTAVRKYMDWLIPLVGPIADEQADNLQKGDYWKGAGGLAGLATSMLAPEVLPAVRARIPSIPVVPKFFSRTTNPVEASAVALGEREGIPMDLGTVTGSPAARNMQKRLEGTIGGAAPTQAFQAEKDLGLTRTGQKFANQVSPTPATAESAGAAMRGAVESHIRTLDSTADAAYSQMRAIEQANPSVMQVNVAATKAGLQSIYDQLLRESELVPLQGGKARALTALDRLMKGPDMVPVSLAEKALSDFKALSRGTEAMPELRTAGQGVSGQAVQQLQAQIDAAAQRGGQPALDALRKGRSATREKYAVADVLDALNSKDVGAFNQVTSRKDTAIAQLRTLKQIAPNAIPVVARAWLDDALATATQEGTFAHTDKLYADWQRMGDATKETLFGAQMTKNLDDFFKLAKDLGKNPNPSGTANVLGFNTAQALAYLPSKYLTKMLYNPAAIKILTQGLRIGGKTGTVFIKEAARVAGVADWLRPTSEAAAKMASGSQDDTDSTTSGLQPSR